MYVPFFSSLIQDEIPRKKVEGEKILFLFIKRDGEKIDQKILPELIKKNKSYYMNFKHKIWVICFYNLNN